MSIRIVCPHCASKVTVKSPDAPGKRVRCPECDERFDPAAVDDDEERPRTKSRNQEDNSRSQRKSSRRDDDNDAPSRRRSKGTSGKRKKQGVSPLLFILPALALVAVVGIGLAVYFAVSKSDPKPESANIGTTHELFSHIHNDARKVHYMEVDKVLSYPGLPPKVRQDLTSRKEKLFGGIPPEEIAVFVWGTGGGEESSALKLSTRPVDQSRIVSLTQGQPTNQDGKSYYRTKSGLMHFPAEGIVGFVNDRRGMPKITNPSRSGENAFPALYSKVSGQMWIGTGGPGLKATAEGREIRIRHSIWQLKLTQDGVELVEEMECWDAAEATSYARQREQNRSRPDERDNQVSQNGSTVIVRKQRPAESSSTLFEKWFLGL